MSRGQEKFVADALPDSWVHRLLPESLWPYAQLARWERPIGWRLLMWPCWWSLMLALCAAPAGEPLPLSLAATGWYLALFTAGAIVMRGAGCTYNDLVDQDLDDRIARTRSRPLPSGRVTRDRAKLFLVAQSLVGFAILLQFNRFSIALGVLSLATVAVYPFMKRITWWPQLFLGLAFSWGALMGWAAVWSSLAPAAMALYAGSILWVIGYDTIYAHQDIEDDALVGVKSTARLFGEDTKPALAVLFCGALLLFAVAFWLAGAAWPAWLGLVLGAAHLAWQVATLDAADPAHCLRLFKSNSHFGWILFLGLAASLAV